MPNVQLLMHLDLAGPCAPPLPERHSMTAKKSTIPTTTPSEVLVRTYSAGVHIGTLQSREGREVTLTNARRLWNWSGAFTLNAVATKGVNRKNSRISVPVATIVLLEAIEIIPVTEVDGRKIGSGKPGPVTDRLRAAFAGLVKNEGTPIPL